MNIEPGQYYMFGDHIIKTRHIMWNDTGGSEDWLVQVFHKGRWCTRRVLNHDLRHKVSRLTAFILCGSLPSLETQ